MDPWGPEQAEIVAEDEDKLVDGVPAYYSRTFPEMYQRHKKIAELRLRGYSPEDIAGIMNSTGSKRRMNKETVLRVLRAPGIIDWLAMQRAKIKEYKQAYDDAKRKAAEEGFGVVVGMVNGEIEPQKVRLDAAIKAMSIDPDRRFEPSNGKKDERSPYTGDTLLEYMEAVKAIEVNFRVVQPDEKQEEVKCLE